jgi:hypothetical protein
LDEPVSGDCRRRDCDDDGVAIFEWLRRRTSVHLDRPGDVVFEHACKLGLEGIVSKRRGGSRLIPA